MRDPKLTSKTWLLRTVALAILSVAAPGIARAQVPVPNCNAALTSCFDIDGTIEDNDNSGVNAVVTTPAGPAGPQALITNDAIKQGNKELGPANSNFKVGTIHTAPLPMLGLTSINNQTDLLRVYTQTGKDGSGDIWYYFGWTRASDSGSGFISIEFQGAKAITGCNYANSNQSIIANCNPWKNRHGGDFLVLWDQNGGSTTVFMRIFQEVGGVVTLPACPQGWPDNSTADTDFCRRLITNDDVFVTYGKTSNGGDDFFRGEMALNLSDTVFNPSGGGALTCRSFANVIPNTVTGNSDSADYKDTVLFDAPDITNCGTLTISKATFPSSLTGTFKYRLTNTNNDTFNGTVDSDCEYSGASKLKCEGLLEQDLASDTISDLLPGGFTVEEYEFPATFTKTSIVCIAPGGTRYVGGIATAPGEQDLDDTPVPVEALGVTACTITNTFNRRTPSATSTQKVTVFDEVTINNIIKHASNANATLRLELYSAAGCAANMLVATSGPISLSGKYVDVNATTVRATVKTADISMILTGSGITIGPGNGVRWWAFRYSGDDLNNGVDSNVNTPPQTCGWEQVGVSFTETTFNP